MDRPPIRNMNPSALRGRTEYLVEATSFELQALWRDHASNCPPDYRSPSYAHRFRWVHGAGELLDAGEIDGRPINVAIMYDDLVGITIGFWEAVSQVVDREQVEATLERIFPEVPRTNAMNFGAAIAHVIKRSDQPTNHKENR